MLKLVAGYQVSNEDSEDIIEAVDSRDLANMRP